MRWNQRPEGSTWGDWGEDDQLGRANLLDADAVLRGVREVERGLAFCLSLPLDLPGGEGLSARRKAPRLSATSRGGVPYVNYPMAMGEGRASDVISDDQVLMSLQFSTQWDSLAHVGALFDADADGVPERVYYNGYLPERHILGPGLFRAREPGQAEDRASSYSWHACDGDHDGHSRARALGVETLAEKCMQGRGVLVDLEAHFGRAPRQIGYDDLMRVMEADRVEVERGDMLLLHTGFADLLLELGDRLVREDVHDHCCALEGRDEKLLQWISDSCIAALVADNGAIERYPSTTPVPANGPYPLLPLHHHCLFKLGLPLGELWHLGPLATWLRANGRSRLMLTAPPLRLPGAMGSPATPVATV